MGYLQLASECPTPLENQLAFRSNRQVLLGKSNQEYLDIKVHRYKKLSMHMKKLIMMEAAINTV
jgi:hypothetical protein